MATTLQTITSNLRMRWRETYVSEGLNQKLVPFPLGIHRGFGVIPSGTALSVTIVADATKGDHVAVYETQGTPRYSLTVHMTSNFDLSLASVAGTTVIIGITATYAIGVDSVATINAYSQAEFSAAAAGSIVALATVVVPASGVIPSGNVSYSNRVSAWQNAAPETIGWYPVMRNSGFESTGTTITSNGLNPAFWRNTNGSAFAPDTTTPHTGLHALMLKTTGAGSLSGDMYQIVNVPVVAGQHLRVRLYKKTLVQLTTGTVQVFVEWGDVAGAVLGSVVTSTFMDNTTLVDAGYKLIDLSFTAPSGTASVRKIGIKLTSFGYGSAQNGCLIDDMQAYVEASSSLDLPSIGDRKGDGFSTSLVVIDPSQTNNDDLQAMLSFDKTAQSGAGRLKLTDRFGNVSPGLEANFLETLASGTTLPALSHYYASTGGTYFLLQEAVDTNAVAAGWSVWVNSLGDFSLVQNAVYNSGTSLWGYRTGFAGALKMTFSATGAIIMYEHHAGTTWADGAWVQLSSFASNAAKFSTAVDYPEMTAPSAPAAATGRFFFQGNGVVSPNHRTQMCVEWPDGTITVIAESNLS